MAEKFIYVTFIRTTPQKLWDALTKPEFTKRYWHETSQDCEWKLGSPWRIVTPDGRIADSGEVLELDPPRRLVVSWLNHLFPAALAEGHSRAVFDLEPAGEAVKLTVTHEFKTPDSNLYRGVSGGFGWPVILSSLKSLLETGESLEATRRWPANV
jgi:uncharacterized protein YndB with AHSA1/START domain